MSTSSQRFDRLRVLARGEPQQLAEWVKQPLERGTLAALLAAIVGGSALYGFSLGLWRAPLMGVFVAIKMPCLIFLTLLVNGLINGMLGQLLGSGMSFKQTLVCCLMSFATFGLLVGSLSPIVLVWILDSPSPESPNSQAWYQYFLLVNTAIIALAGVIANFKLLRLIQAFTGSPAVGWRTLLAWLSGNLFVGAQISFILRPFFGNPNLPVEFLRAKPFEGNFYQTVWYMIEASVGGTALPLLSGILTITLPILGFLGLLWILAGKPKPPADISQPAPSPAHDR